MSLRPYKFVVTAIPQVVDDDGNVSGEAQADPVVLFGCDQLMEWAQVFPEKLAAADA